MSLYDRNYANSRQEEVSSSYAETNLSAFIKQTYQLLAASLLAASAGAYVGIGMAASFSAPMFIGLVIAEFALLFGLTAAKRKAGLNFRFWLDFYRCPEARRS